MCRKPALQNVAVTGAVAVRQVPSTINEQDTRIRYLEDRKVMMRWRPENHRGYGAWEILRCRR